MILRPEADHINFLNLLGRFAQNLSKIIFKIFHNFNYLKIFIMIF